MNVFSRSIAVFVCLVLCGSIAGLAQKGETQDEHDKQIKADTERNTKYHNNADDYPKPTASSVPVNGPARAPVGTLDIGEMYRIGDAIARSKDERFQRAYSGAQGLNEDAMMELAGDYAEGYGTPVDKERAMATYSSVASLGPAQAYRVGVLLSQPGPAADNVEAYRNMKKAADGGVDAAKKWIATHPEPVRHAGELPSMLSFVDDAFRTRGAGVPTTTEGAADKLLREWAAESAAKQENFKKRAKLSREALAAGKATLYGAGVAVNLPRANELLSIAASGNDIEATREGLEYLGWMEWAAMRKSGSQDFSAFGTAIFKKDFVHTPALEYLRAVYTCAIGNHYQQRTHLEASTGTFVKSEFPQAKADLAVMKLEGVGGPLDEKAGMAELNGAADEGNHNAQYMLGLIYERGLHRVTKDPARAAKMFQTAASSGQADAAKHLTQVGMAKP